MRRLDLKKGEALPFGETRAVLKANTHALACGITEAGLGGETSMCVRYRRGNSRAEYSAEVVVIL